MKVTLRIDDFLEDNIIKKKKKKPQFEGATGPFKPDVVSSSGCLYHKPYEHSSSPTAQNHAQAKTLTIQIRPPESPATPTRTPNPTKPLSVEVRQPASSASPSVANPHCSTSLLIRAYEAS